ncbi:MAG: FHIPEP family type III secretion protein [Nannocystaceae bacterium]
MSRPLDADAPLGAALRRFVQPLPRYLPALGVVALLVCMLVPLSTEVVDLLLSLSLALGVLLLVACLGIRRSADFLAFPTLLLLATLMRLALNVQTTRLILSDANAGHVIDAFAQLVVRGNMVVGGVLFAIITAVQYLVIARGAERVAEVAARFALDGLPGGQAAIDADLRSGAISAHEAARRRASLIERSRFYGAMDGAIRFVKGDAIAGLAITAINLLGGIAIGVLQRDLSLVESLTTYGRLTIGDGLVAQIPALLISLAAGVLVSRVDREGSERGPILAWVEPATLLFPAVLLGGLAMIQGMPRAAFTITALGLLCSGLWLAAGRSAELQAPIRRVRVLCSSAVVGDARNLRRALGELRRRCVGALGVQVPEIVLEASPEAAVDAVEVRYGDRTLGRRELQGGDEDTIVVEVFRVIMAAADAFVDLHDLEMAIEELRSARPAVVREALRVVTLPDVLTLVHGFLRERLPMPALDALLGAIAGDRRFAEASERGRWIELAREHLAGHWLRDLVAAQERLGPVIWVRPIVDAEDEIRSRVIAGSGGRSLSLRGGERDAWITAIRGAAGADAAIIVLTTAGGRGAFAALLRGATPFIPVVSVAELGAAGLGEVTAERVRWLSPP